MLNMVAEKPQGQAPKIEAFPADRLANLARLVPGIKLNDLRVERGLIRGHPSLSEPRMAYDGISATRTGTSYAETMLQLLKREIRAGTLHENPVAYAMSRMLNGQVLLDLGAGTTPNGYLLTSEFGIIGYVGVEANHADILVRHMPSDGTATVPSEIVSEDMLHFLRRVPENSVSVMAAGIDCIIVPDVQLMSDIEKEIKRVLHPEGCFVGCYSDIVPDLPLVCSMGDAPFPRQEIYSKGKTAES
jgi:hypothetical protein